MPWRVEPVRPHVVRVPESELPCARVHHRHEPSLASFTDVVGERVRGVVCALDQRSFEQLADCHLFAGGEVDRRLTDGCRPRRDGDDVARLRPLDGQEHGHQLRQARDGNAGAVVVAGKHVTAGAVFEEVRMRVDSWYGGESGSREGESSREDGQPTRHFDKGIYQPEAAQISLLSRAASWEAPTRQSSPEERKPYVTLREAATSALAGPLVKARATSAGGGPPAPPPPGSRRLGGRA